MARAVATNPTRLGPWRMARPLAIWGMAFVVIVALGAGPRLLPQLEVCTSGVLPGDEALETGPYVQNVTATGATVRWWNERDEAGTFFFWEEGGPRRQFAPTGGAVREVVLTGLRPGTLYEYRVEGEAGNGRGGFRTDPGPGATVVAGVLGDSGSGEDAQDAVGRVLAQMKPDLVVHTGDVVYPDGELCDYGEKFFEPYAEMLAVAPIFPTVGNHDLASGDGGPYDQVFALPVDEPGETRRRYAYTYGPLRVVVVDSEVYERGDEAEIAAQRSWLEEVLAAGTDRPWTVVVVHHPPFTALAENDAPEIRGDLTPIFARHGVDLVLSGDVHAYERVHPVDGVTYVVTGGGGAELHRELAPGPQTAAAVSIFHAVRIEAGPERLVLEAIDRDGEVFDRAELPADPGAGGCGRRCSAIWQPDPGGRADGGGARRPRCAICAAGGCC